MADFDGRVTTRSTRYCGWSPADALPPHRHQDYQLGDVTFKEGDKVVMWYIGSNRDDEDVFENSMTMDISRDESTTPSVLRRRRPTLLPGHIPRPRGAWRRCAIYHRMPNSGGRRARPAASNFMNGTKRLPATWTPEKKKPS